jgi:hypothetical protein
MTTIEVTLQYTRHMTFHIDDTTDPVAAVRHAEGRLMYDGGNPDDEEMPDLELEQIKVGDREIRISASMDFGAPKTALGLSPWKYTAYEGRYGRQKVAEGYDRAAVIRSAFAAAQVAGEAS